MTRIDRRTGGADVKRVWKGRWHTVNWLTPST
jgi:hypothetical protein